MALSPLLPIPASKKWWVQKVTPREEWRGELKNQIILKNRLIMPWRNMKFITDDTVSMITRDLSDDLKSKICTGMCEWVWFGG